MALIGLIIFSGAAISGFKPQSVLSVMTAQTCGKVPLEGCSEDQTITAPSTGGSESGSPDPGSGSSSGGGKGSGAAGGGGGPAGQGSGPGKIPIGCCAPSTVYNPKCDPKKCPDGSVVFAANACPTPPPTCGPNQHLEGNTCVDNPPTTPPTTPPPKPQTNSQKCEVDVGRLCRDACWGAGAVVGSLTCPELGLPPLIGACAFGSGAGANECAERCPPSTSNPCTRDPDRIVYCATHPGDRYCPENR
jgi:hypothetical protein